MASQLYRMRIENTQFTDIATGWTLAWPKGSPPELKPLPKAISPALQNRIDAGSIVLIPEERITGDEIVIDDAGPAAEAVVPNGGAGEGRARPEHVASYKVREPGAAATRRARDGKPAGKRQPREAAEAQEPEAAGA